MMRVTLFLIKAIAMQRDYAFIVARYLTIALPVLILWPVPSDIAICTIAALFLWRSARTRDWSWCRERWAQVLGILWLYMVARGLFAAHPHDAMGRALPFGRYIVFSAGIARWTLLHAPTRRLFARTLTAMVVVSACDGLLQWLIDFDLLLHLAVHVPSAGAEHVRLTGPFSKPILGIMLTWLAFPALLPLLLTPNGKPKESRKLLEGLACMLATFAAIALSGERIALMLLLMGCCAGALLLPLRKRVVLMGLVAIVALLGALALLSPAMVKRQVVSTQETLAHWNQSPYGMLLASDLTLAVQNPVFGLGTGQFRTSCEALYVRDTARIQEMCKTHPHNVYLEWLIESGIIGLGLFVAFMVAVFGDCARVFSKLKGNPLFTGMLIAFIFRAWPFMSSTGFFSRWASPPFWLVLGGLLVYTRRQPEPRDADPAFTLQDTGL